MAGIAEPTRAAAEGNALSQISGLARTRNPKWHGMRVGVTRKIIYVAPRQRGRLSRVNRRLARPNMFNLLHRQMQAAAERYRATYEGAVAHAFDRIADRFNHGGTT